MIRVHIGMDLEHKATECRFFRIHASFNSFDRPGARRNFHKTVKKFLYTECIECGTKKHRRQFTFFVFFFIEIRVDAFDKRQVIA